MTYENKNLEFLQEILLVVGRREYKFCLSVFGAYEHFAGGELGKRTAFDSFVNVGVQKLHQKQMLPVK